jgi:hypothetical protein
MTSQDENVGASSALIGQGKEKNQNTGLGFNIFDNPFAEISVQECLVTMRDILDNPEIPSEIIDIRIAQLEAVSPRGVSLCYQEGVLPYRG